MKTIYFDYAASTPMDPRVLAAMNPYFSEKFGNPGAVHQFGQEASAAIFSARRRIAESLGADYSNIIFTGSATQANNLALRGVVKAYQKLQTSNVKRQTQRPRIIISAFEHPSVLETARDLEKAGAELIVVPVNKAGLVNVQKIKSALNKQTALVSVMYVNNEVGTIQPIAEIAKMIQEYRIQNIESRKKHAPKSYILNPTFYPLLHTDAVQAFQYLNCRVDDLGVDLMTFSAHKIYGPKGIGALYIRNKQKVVSSKGNSTPILLPVITGGGQEMGLHSGTENTPYIVGFAKTVELTERLRKPEAQRISKLRDYCWRQIKKIVPAARINGFLKNRLPNNLNIYIPQKPSYELAVALDLKGVSVSPGEACSARAIKPSPTLLAMGLGSARALQSLRITFGRPTNKKTVDFLIGALRDCFKLK